MSVDILKENNFKFNKKFGQNFIFDQNFLNSIVVGNITQEDDILEIGAGAGTLTKTLSNNARKVISFEIDENLRSVLKDSLKGCNNVEVIFKDVMKEDTIDIDNRFEGEYILFANLPYYITTPIIFKFLKESKKLKTMYIMVQKEVADRICSKPGGKDYGVLTVSIQSVANVSIVKKVSRNMFMPVPNVDSAIVKIELNKSKMPKELDMDRYFRLVADAFSMRRKTLENNLKKYNNDKFSIEDILKDCNIKMGSRAESLTISDFINISTNIQGILAKSIKKD